MATKVKEIRDLIVQKLQGCKVGGKDAFKHVTGYAEGEFSGYPAASVFPTGGHGIVLDTHRNERTFEFSAYLYQEQTEAGKTAEGADAALIDALDSVIEAFDTDRDLGGAVEIVRVISFEVDFTATGGPANFARVKIEAVQILPNFA